ALERRAVFRQPGRVRRRGRLSAPPSPGVAGDGAPGPCVRARQLRVADRASTLRARPGSNRTFRMTAPGSTFPIAGQIGLEAEETVRKRLAERYERAVIDRDEVARVAAMRLHTFEGSEAASEIFRRCCVTWEVDRETTITSHRPVIGPVLVAVKR